jgi:hypothetical protein
MARSLPDVAAGRVSIREAAKKERLRGTLMMVAQDQAGQTRIASKNWLLLSIAGGTRIDLPGRKSARFPIAPRATMRGL